MQLVQRTFERVCGSIADYGNRVETGVIADVRLNIVHLRVLLVRIRCVEIKSRLFGFEFAHRRRVVSSGVLSVQMPEGADIVLVEVDGISAVGLIEGRHQGVVVLRVLEA